MGQLTDSLKATLRELAQSDARLYRGLQQELADPGAASGQPPPPLPSPPSQSPSPSQSQSLSPPPPLPEAEPRASREELRALTKAVLLDLCKQRAMGGLSGKGKDQLIEALLSHPDGPPLCRSLPARPTRGSRASAAPARSTPGAGAPELQALEQRLERLEQMLVLIARQVGVAPAAIAPLFREPIQPPP